LINSVHELEDLLSTPTEEDIEAASRLDGNLVILGAGGKMGPTLAIRAKRAIQAAGKPYPVIAVSRFSDQGAGVRLRTAGVEIVSADLLDRQDIARLPDANNLIFMVGRKFGSTGDEPTTWAMNAHVPALVMDRYARCENVVVLSSGNVYPFMPLAHGGATEKTPPAPIGEYAQSVLARERIFQYFCEQYDKPMAIIRLNYAVDLRYGVLLDIGLAVHERRPVDLRMGMLNCIWQGDANSVCLRAHIYTDVPPRILNLTGPETLSVRWIALRFGEIFGVEPHFEGTEGPTALLNNAARCHGLFGYPKVSVDQMIEWTAQWIGVGGETHNKPTHFEVRDGRF
jgi:nucleoside-diphosphate-sugar epimerase